MSKLNILWTALPNGFNESGNMLRLSVLVSPRLVTVSNNLIDKSIQNNSNLIVRSYHVKKVVSFVKQTYQNIATKSPDQIPTRDAYGFQTTPQVFEDTK